MSDIAAFKPSLNFTNLLSEELRNDSENFTLFIKAYYEWLQTVAVTVEDADNEFERDEIITGDSSLASGIIKQVDTANNLIVVKMTTNRPFDLRETITANTSATTATVIQIKDNVVRQSGQLLNYRNATKTVDQYVEFLKAELYASIPPDLYANERLVARKFKEFFKAKSNEDSYKFLFRVLYGEDIEVRYPGEDLLRVSDGKYEKTTIIRAASTSNIFNFLNQTITGANSEAVGNVVDIKVLNVGSTEVAEMTLTLVSGVFDGNETIQVVGDSTTNTTLYGMVTGFTINDGGSGYTVGDVITISSNTGSEAQATVSSIKASPITAISVVTPGYGYRLNTNATINNTGTGGTGLALRVTNLANTYTVTSGATTYTVGETETISIINRGSGYFAKPTITIEDTTISSLGLLTSKLITIANTGSNYGVGNTLIFTGGSGANAAGQVASVTANASYSNTLLFEDGFNMLAETGYDDVIKTEDWSVLGPIRRIELTNFGTGYTSANLPSITVSSTTGSGANLIPIGIQGAGANVIVDVANNSTGIGSIRAINISDFGVGYTSATANATSVGDGNANLTPIISGIGTKEGTWINDDGKIDYKIIQDSEYYQDFSYVIRSGLVFDRYSSIVKEVIHPAGMQFFGEILIQSNIDVTPAFTTTIEALNNVVSYIYYIELSGDAQVQANLASVIKVLSVLESVVQAQTSLYSAIEFIVQPRSDIDISTIAWSTIEILDNISRYVLLVKSLIQTNTATPVRTKNVIIAKRIAESYSTPIDPIDLTYADYKLSAFANSTISLYANTTFDAERLSSVTTYSKIPGTVSVSGNTVIGVNTAFTTNFSVGSNFIVSTEKFIVSNVANSTYMQLNVNALSTYTNVSAYA